MWNDGGMSDLRRIPAAQALENWQLNGNTHFICRHLWAKLHFLEIPQSMQIIVIIQLFGSSLIHDRPSVVEFGKSHNFLEISLIFLIIKLCSSHPQIMKIVFLNIPIMLKHFICDLITITTSRLSFRNAPLMSFWLHKNQLPSIKSQVPIYLIEESTLG